MNKLVLILGIIGIVCGGIGIYYNEHRKQNQSIRFICSLGLAIGILDVLLYLMFNHFIKDPSPTSYHIEVVDENGMLVDYWNGTYVVKDSTLLINDGMEEYKLRPGETIKTSYDSPPRF